MCIKHCSQSILSLLWSYFLGRGGHLTDSWRTVLLLGASVWIWSLRQLTLNVGQACCFLSHPLWRCVQIGQPLQSSHHCLICSVHLNHPVSFQGPPLKVLPPWVVFCCPDKVWCPLCLYCLPAGRYYLLDWFVNLSSLREDMSCTSLIIKCPGASTIRLGIGQGPRFPYTQEVCRAGEILRNPLSQHHFSKGRRSNKVLHCHQHPPVAKPGSLLTCKAAAIAQMIWTESQSPGEV